ncbi:MAG TPA: glycoside hydrolase family 43 C-terminal domain-containing protein [Brumimicrobium sp.]|nr:glycoside hydrolase family 43 C-terminal domain-containing protein [Brumimicrobium sp.]
MKNGIKLFVSILTLVFVLSACNKYEEGPKFSLLTKKARITGTWELEKTVSSNGTVEYNNDEGDIVINKDGSYVLTVNGFGVSGDWKFVKDKEYISVTVTILGNTKVDEFQILRLKNKELWLKDSEGKVAYYVGV